MVNEIGHQGRKAAVVAVGPSIFNDDVLAINVAGITQTLLKCGRVRCERFSGAVVEEPDHGHGRLLRTQRERPRYGRTENRNECASIHEPPGNDARRKLKYIAICDRTMVEK